MAGARSAAGAAGAAVSSSVLPPPANRPRFCLEHRPAGSDAGSSWVPAKLDEPFAPSLSSPSCEALPLISGSSAPACELSKATGEASGEVAQPRTPSSCWECGRDAWLWAAPLWP